MSSDCCLNCILPDCDESNPGCGLWKNKIKPGNAFYHRHKNDPEFLKNRYEIKKKWRKSPSAHESMRKSAKKYRDSHYAKVRAIEILSFRRCACKNETNVKNAKADLSYISSI